MVIQLRPCMIVITHTPPLRVYGRTTTAMHEVEYISPIEYTSPPSPSPANTRLCAQSPVGAPLACSPSHVLASIASVSGRLLRFSGHL